MAPSTSSSASGDLRLETRVATPADAAVLASLRWLLRTEDGAQPCGSQAGFVAQTRAWFESCGTRGWISWLATRPGDDQVLGNVSLLLVDKLPTPEPSSTRVGYVTNLYVRPSERNQGIGRQLLDAVVAWAEGERLDTLVVWPSEASSPLYRRAGFSGENEVHERRIAP